MPPALRFFFRRDRDHDAIRRSVDAICREVSRRGGLVSGHGDVIEAALHPALPAFVCRPVRDGVEATITTWPGGPGFHLACIATMELAARAADVEFKADDTSGYERRRDRRRIEQAFADALVEKAGLALSFFDAAGGRAHVQFGLPLPGSPDALRLPGDPPGVYTMEAKRDRGFLVDLASGQTVPSEFYPWWAEELSDAGARRLARALAFSQLTFRPARTERQSALRRIALQGLSRGPDPSPEELGIRAVLEALAAGSETAAPPSLRTKPRQVPLAGGWTAVVPGHFETAYHDAPHAPPIETGLVYLDHSTRVEAFSQAAPEGVSLDERIGNLLLHGRQKSATRQRLPTVATPYGGYATERTLADGGYALLGWMVGAETHLILRIVTDPQGDPVQAGKIFESIVPEQASPTFFAI